MSFDLLGLIGISTESSCSLAGSSCAAATCSCTALSSDGLSASASADDVHWMTPEEVRRYEIVLGDQ